MNTTTKTTVKATKATKSPATKGPTKVTSNTYTLIASLNARGVDAASARDAFVAREFILNPKTVGARLAESTGMQTSEVSRIKVAVIGNATKGYKPLSKAAQAKFIALSTTVAANRDGSESYAAAIALGKTLKRDKGAALKRTGDAPAATRTAIDKDSGVTVNSEATPRQIVTDAAAAILDSLAGQDEDVAAELYALVMDILTPENVTAARAELVAA